MNLFDFHLESHIAYDRCLFVTNTNILGIHKILANAVADTHSIWLNIRTRHIFNHISIFHRMVFFGNHGFFGSRLPNMAKERHFTYPLYSRRDKYSRTVYKSTHFMILFFKILSVMGQLKGDYCCLANLAGKLLRI